MKNGYGKIELSSNHYLTLREATNREKVENKPVIVISGFIFLLFVI